MQNKATRGQGSRQRKKAAKAKQQIRNQLQKETEVDDPDFYQKRFFGLIFSLLISWLLAGGHWIK